MSAAASSREVIRLTHKHADLSPYVTERGGASPDGVEMVRDGHRHSGWGRAISPLSSNDFALGRTRSTFNDLGERGGDM